MADDQLNGKELDAAVAERVMGWRTSTISENVWHSEAEHNSFHKDKFRPSESIEAAMQVVEKMREKHWCISIMNQFATGPRWLATFEGRDGQNIREVSADSNSLPDAICRAALAAIGANK